MVIDARGIGCPKPVLMAEEALSKITEGTLEVLVDNEASVENLKRFATKNGFFVEDKRLEGHWKVIIVKGYPCSIEALTGVDSAKKDLFIIVATDTFGKDEALGRILMKAYFETMRVYKELPSAIFFMNTGVRLTTVDEELCGVIKDIAAMGVEVYTCGTCLKYFNLEDQLKVGLRGTTNHIIEGQKEYSRTVWIG
jgi:selenium metabolism protein YedF